MIFKKFEESDIVAGRSSRVASGFWPEGVTHWSQSLLVDDFWELTGSSATPSPSYGISQYDIRRTMYYLNVFPNEFERSNNNPYFSLTYGNYNGDGTFDSEPINIKASPTKAIYTQYKNLLLGTSDLDGKFSFKIGSAGGTVDADDIFVLSFSSYKMKDKIDEGVFEISFAGSKGVFTFIDDSSLEIQTKNVYNLISGSIESGIHEGSSYEGIGLLYPQTGMLVLNAATLNELVGLDDAAFDSDDGGPYNYNDTSFDTEYTQNHKVIFESIKKAGLEDEKQLKVRKSEYVPSRQYFVRVKNRDFNYSNNPTYVHDGSDGENSAGTIRHSDFIEDPKTYPTTVGLYNDANELIAVAKLSRPAMKSFDNELLIKVKLDI